MIWVLAGVAVLITAVLAVWLLRSHRDRLDEQLIGQLHDAIAPKLKPPRGRESLAAHQNGREKDKSDG